MKKEKKFVGFILRITIAGTVAVMILLSFISAGEPEEVGDEVIMAILVAMVAGAVIIAPAPNKDPFGLHPFAFWFFGFFIPLALVIISLNETRVQNPLEEFFRLMGLIGG